jgi:hypothetical protein
MQISVQSDHAVRTFRANDPGEAPIRRAHQWRWHMVRKLEAQTVVLIIQSLLITCLGLALLWIRSTMTNLLFEVAGCITAVLLTAAGLLLIGALDLVGGLAIRKGHRRELHLYLFLGATSMIAGLVFWFSSWGSVQILACLAGLQGLFWGVWDLRMASHLRDHPRERTALRILGFITLVLGCLLVVGMEQSSRTALVLLGLYSTYIGIHVFLIGVYVLYFVEPRCNPKTSLQSSENEVGVKYRRASCAGRLSQVRCSRRLPAVERQM